MFDKKMFFCFGDTVATMRAYGMEPVYRTDDDCEILCDFLQAAGILQNGLFRDGDTYAVQISGAYDRLSQLGFDYDAAITKAGGKFGGTFGVGGGTFIRLKLP